jgi:hypothetical protein
MVANYGAGVNVYLNALTSGYTLDGTDMILDLLSGIDIQDDVDTSERISVRAMCNYLNSTTIECQIDGLHPGKIFRIRYVGI